MRHKSLLYKVVVSWSGALRHVATVSGSLPPTPEQRAPAVSASCCPVRPITEFGYQRDPDAAPSPSIKGERLRRSPPGGTIVPNARGAGLHRRLVLRKVPAAEMFPPGHTLKCNRPLEPGIASQLRKVIRATQQRLHGREVSHARDKIEVPVLAADGGLVSGAGKMAALVRQR